jgi:CheY-like chemotaxis protein
MGTDGSGPKRILVVSDDPLVREQARFGFPAGVAVSFADDARDAIRSLRDEQPAAVVVDMQTGSAGAVALLRDMAQTPRLARIPTLVLLQRDQDAWLAQTAGATAYRTKPLGPGRLAGAVLPLTAGVD